MVSILLLLAAVIGAIALIVLLFKFLFDRNTSEQIIQKYKGTPESKSVYIKKYPESDPTQFTGVFMRVGLVFALALVILAFSWTKTDKTSSLSGELFVPDDFEVEPPATQREIQPPPPPPPPEIKVVEDDEIIEEEPEVLFEEVTEESVIETKVEMMEEVVQEDEIFTIVEDMPVFPGGESALLKFLGSIQYPAMARENDIEGTVFIRFVVDKNGKVTSVEVAKGADRILNEAALAHVKKMPDWAPGKQRGKPVRVQYIVPIRFKLN